MTEKRFKIVDEQFISYYGGTGHKISNGECGFWLWHDKTESQKVCDKLNSILDENEQLEQQMQQLQHWNKCLAEKRHQELSYKPYTSSKSEKELKELLEPKLFNCSDR